MSRAAARSARTVLAATLFAGSCAAYAQVQDKVVLSGGNSEAGVNGRLAVNSAAGEGNQQINDATIALGDIAWGNSQVRQDITGTDSRDRATYVGVEGDAFANSTGLVSVNAAAGIQNQMANIAVLSIGRIGAISDQLLAQSRAPSEPSGSTGGAEARNDVVAISDDAFRDSSGLVQINLIGGERNSSANTFVLNVLAEVSP